jgi:7-cyano-7-deazaguanine synthase
MPAATADRRAVVLLSGGLDSATVLALALHDSFRVTALSFRYGQRHAQEVAAAQRVASAAGVRDHVILDIDLRAFGASALTAEIDVPKRPAGGGDAHGVAPAGGRIPVTYVPARNTIFLAYALALAEVRSAGDLFIGVSAVDYSGYPDCRPEYVAAFQRLAELATRAAVEGAPLRLHAPLLHLSKAQTIEAGLALGVDYGLTRSCYDPDAQGRACGACDSCRLRLAAFARLGREDPAPYVTSPRP